MSTEPTRLVEVDDRAADGLVDPVLVVALDGYVDAGNGVALTVAHLLGGDEPEPAGDVVARFDADALVDYRSRRPPLVYSGGRFTSYARPELVVRRLRDRAGTDYLLLAGPEPDLRWEEFCGAVAELVQRLGVRLTVVPLAIPMAVPHTRPAGISKHASLPGLVGDDEDLFGTVTVPGHVGGVLEFRFGELGLPAVGLAQHVPHYLARSDHPVTAQRLLQAVEEASGLALDPDALNHAIGTFDAQLAEELTGNTEVQQVVAALEQQYDAFVAARGRSLLAPSEPLPTADELAAQVERFLADQN